MSWLDSFLPSSFVEALPSASSLFSDPNTLVPILQTGATLIGGLTKPDPVTPYSQTKEYADAQLQLQRDELALKERLAMMGGGGGSGALQAKIALKQLKERAMANALAMKIDLLKGRPDVEQAAVAQAGQGQANLGRAGLEGFGNAANLLARFKA